MFYAKQALKGKIVQQFTFLSLCTARTHFLFMCKECAVKSSNSAKITMTLEQQELTDKPCDCVLRLKTNITTDSHKMKTVNKLSMYSQLNNLWSYSPPQN